MILYRVDENGKTNTKKADKGPHGEYYFNPREWSPGAPPEAPGKIAVIDDLTLQWKLVDDNRGVWYDTETGLTVEIFSLNKDVTGLTRLEPKDDFQKWNGEAWETDKEKIKAFEEMEKAAAIESKIQDEMRRMAVENLSRRK